MDVGQPIASVIPSLDGPVLGALASTTAPLTLTRVHRLAGRGSLTGVRRVLLRLVGAGLVLEVPGGYLLNREHVAAAAVEALAGLHGELVARIRREVGSWRRPPALVGLYGSAARRDGDERSDVDLLVVSDDPDAAARAEGLASQVRRWTGNRAHVVALTPAECARLRSAGEPLVASWDRELVVVAGDRSALGGRS